MRVVTAQASLPIAADAHSICQGQQSVVQKQRADLAPQGLHGLCCRDLLEGDGEGVLGVPLWIGANQAAQLDQHLTNCRQCLDQSAQTLSADSAVESSKLM